MENSKTMKLDIETTREIGQEIAGELAKCPIKNMGYAFTKIRDNAIVEAKFITTLHNYYENLTYLEKLSEKYPGADFVVKEPVSGWNGNVYMLAAGKLVKADCEKKG